MLRNPAHCVRVVMQGVGIHKRNMALAIFRAKESVILIIYGRTIFSPRVVHSLLLVSDSLSGANLDDIRVTLLVLTALFARAVALAIVPFLSRGGALHAEVINRDKTISATALFNSRHTEVMIRRNSSLQVSHHS